MPGLKIRTSWRGKGTSPLSFPGRVLWRSRAGWSDGEESARVFAKDEADVVLTEMKNPKWLDEVVAVEADEEKGA